MLVVDDEASIRDLLAKTLALAEYDVDVAPDGRSALERMRMYPYDLLIADLKMPGMDGLTVIREAKRYKADLPVIIITGLLHRVERDRGRQPRRRRLPDQAVPGAAGARRGRQGPRGMIQLSELTKSFGDRVLLDHVTWQITDRERVGLCGPNGAGKTTLLKMMAGLDEPDTGAILKPSGAHRRLPAAGRPLPHAAAPSSRKPRCAFARRCWP